MSGDHGRAAELLATLADADPSQVQFAQQALTEAIDSGNMDLALSLVSKVPPDKVSTDARLLLVTQAVKARRIDRALPWLSATGPTGDLSFLVPLLTAWDYAERGDAGKALATINQIPSNGLLAPISAEEQALILLKFKRTADAEPIARRAIAASGARETQVRLELADGFLAAGDRNRAIAMIDGMSGDIGIAKQRIAAGKPSGLGVDTAAEALSEVLTGFAADLVRLQRSALPVGLVQVARYANPQNTGATALLALLLNQQDRPDEALALLRTVPPNDALISQVRDIEVRVLDDQKRYNEAYAIAAAAAASPTAGIADYSRLGDVFEGMKRHDEAAASYGRAVTLAKAQGLKDEVWPLLLLQASTLEEANRWPETRQALQEALAIAPDQPLLLNFLGYAELERGENLDSAEAMIRKASELAPDEASITDSLGWAEFKRGKVDEAITTLQTAAAKDPDEADIQEHLGDALYKAGRRMEARFAWSAAMVTAEDDVAVRVKAKLSSGLTSANAAP
jgi:tetratricopeptide (TPR) repeat protein